jgi:hypothetical protein
MQAITCGAERLVRDRVVGTRGCARAGAADPPERGHRAPWSGAGCTPPRVLTIVYHVPHNDSLALAYPNTTAPPPSGHGASQWTAWNHVRTLTSLASVTFTLALR